MINLKAVCESLAKIAPLDLAEEWDNVGLLIGDPKQSVERILTCLTLTPNVVEEAMNKKVSLVVTHHPLPFRSFKRITTDTIEGASLWRLIGNQIAVYSAHTAFDSANQGINQQIAEKLELKEITPFVPSEDNPQVGTGRIGLTSSSTSLAVVADQIKQTFELDTVRVVGNQDQVATKVAIACGSGGSLFEHAQAAGGDLFLTGEATFHDCLKAEALGIGLVLTGHYASERFAMERLAIDLSKQFPELNISPSASEKDPLSYI